MRARWVAGGLGPRSGETACAENLTSSEVVTFEESVVYPELSCRNAPPRWVDKLAGDERGSKDDFRGGLGLYGQHETKLPRAGWRAGGLHPRDAPTHTLPWGLWGDEIDLRGCWAVAGTPRARRPA